MKTNLIRAALCHNLKKAMPFVFSLLTGSGAPKGICDLQIVPPVGEAWHSPERSP
jgi:hypothetical protein